MMILKKISIDKEMRRLDIITGLLCLLPVLAGVILYSRLPSEMAVNFNLNDKPDIYAGKAFVVFGVPLFMLLVHAILCIVSETDDKKNNVNRKFTYILRFVAPAAVITAEAFIFMYSLGYMIKASAVAFILLGVIVFALGNYLPKCKPNRYMAFRLPWTMNDEANWNKTHRLAGWLWVPSGIFLILLGMFDLPAELLPIPVTLIFAAPCIYSFLLSLKGRNRNNKVQE